ncbi:hypothetical protein TNCV_2983671 [Trichonephila clavipes]|nr:hypothetical protein TNCV_2983671 [Trichonephila clavipes]
MTIYRQFGGLQGCKILETAAISDSKTVFTRLDGKSNWAWRIETYNSFHTNLSLYYTSSTILAGEDDAPISQQSCSRRFQWVIHLEAGVIIKTSLSKNVRTQRVICRPALSSCW